MALKKFKHCVIKSDIFSPQWHHWGGSACLRSGKPLTPTQDPWEPSQELELIPEMKEVVHMKVCSVRTGWSVQLDFTTDLPSFHVLDQYCDNRLSVSTPQRELDATSTCCLYSSIHLESKWKRRLMWMENLLVNDTNIDYGTKVPLIWFQVNFNFTIKIQSFSFQGSHQEQCLPFSLSLLLCAFHYLAIIERLRLCL